MPDFLVGMNLSIPCSSLVANLSHILRTLVVARSDCVSSEWRSLLDFLSWSQSAILYNKIVSGTCFDSSGFAFTLANTISWSERPGMIDTLSTRVGFVVKNKSRMF